MIQNPRDVAKPVAPIDSIEFLFEGIASNLFFMTHSHNEMSDPTTHSKSNKFEAEIVVSLAHHFLQNDYSQEEITILATYRGQV